MKNMILADTGFFIALGNKGDHDFADASLVVLAEHLGHGRILTCDRRDFSIYRWNDTNPFENLLLEQS
jgi:predicted nucleic acid-binding protein